MNENLEILIRGEITYRPQNTNFMILVDDAREKYKRNPTPECLTECVVELKNYISKYDTLIKTDLRLLNAIIAYRNHIFA